MLKDAARTTRAKTHKPNRRKPVPKRDEKEEALFRGAIGYCISKVGGLCVPSAVREIRVRGLPAWIFTIVIRYPVGPEGYIGDLLYDGEDFTMLTEESVINERVEQIANDPERKRLWDEFRAVADKKFGSQEGKVTIIQCK